MSWQEGLNMFAWGFVAGYFWHPLWTVAKKIFTEAQKALKEW
jgi:hypothetical protein